MLLSKKRKFIFIHIKKNAGTSISDALYPFTANPVARFCERALRKMNPKIRVSFGGHPFVGHITAPDLVKQIGRAEFERYFSFAVVRNPWDWQTSLYTYILKRPPHPLHNKLKELGSFEEYIKWHCTNILNDTIPDGCGAIFQSECLCDEDGEVLVKYVARFENLDKDFRHICETIGVHAELPRLRVSKSKHYREFYNEETKNLVEDCFRQDIERFGYSY